MTKYALWGWMPIICGFSYNIFPNPGIAVLISAYVFPLFWLGLGYKAYAACKNDFWIILKLHIPIMICLSVVIIRQLYLGDLGNCVGFIENEKNMIVFVKGSIAHKAFLPMMLLSSPFGLLVSSYCTDEILLQVFAYFDSILLMFVLNWLGYQIRKKEIDINNRFEC